MSKFLAVAPHPRSHFAIARARRSASSQSIDHDLTFLDRVIDDWDR
jgi:hypothetical protein